MKLVKIIIILIFVYITQACCLGGDNVTSTRLQEVDIDFLPYSAEFATEFIYFYSKTEDTLSLIFDRPVREIDDRRNGPESCNVREFEIYDTQAFKSGVQITCSMRSESSFSSLSYAFRDFNNDLSLSYSYMSCNSDLALLDFTNCVDSFEINGELFENVLVLESNGTTEAGENLIALVNSQSGLVYAALNDTDFIRIVEVN